VTSLVPAWICCWVAASCACAAHVVLKRVTFARMKFWSTLIASTVCKSWFAARYALPQSPSAIAFVDSFSSDAAAPRSLGSKPFFAIAVRARCKSGWISAFV
jgi:hypothetical protein